MSAFTFKQYVFKFKDVNKLTQGEVDGYTLGDFLLPKDGTLVKTKDSSMVFLIQSELLRPISTTVFKLHKFQQSKIVTLTINELAAANLGSFLPPPEKTPTLDFLMVQCSFTVMVPSIMFLLLCLNKEMLNLLQWSRMKDDVK